FISPAIAHDAHGLHREQHGEGLPDLVVLARLADFVEIDRIGLTEDVELFAGDAARAADGKARSREGVAANKALRNAEIAAELADFVLEQFAQRLDQLHVHAFWQAAHIVVRLDGDRGAASERHRFDDVGIKRTLGEELRAAELLGFFLESFDEETANDLALGFRVGLTFKLTDELVGCIDVNQRDVELIAEHGHDLLALVHAHKAMIDIDAGELIADGFVDEHGCNRGIDAAGETADHAAGADLFADLVDHLLTVGLHGP